MRIVEHVRRRIEAGLRIIFLLKSSIKLNFPPQKNAFFRQVFLSRISIKVLYEWVMQMKKCELKDILLSLSKGTRLLLSGRSIPGGGGSFSKNGPKCRPPPQPDSLVGGPGKILRPFCIWPLFPRLGAKKKSVVHTGVSLVQGGPLQASFYRPQGLYPRHFWSAYI